MNKYKRKKTKQEKELEEIREKMREVAKERALLLDLV